MIEELKTNLPDFAKDIRLNLSNVLTEAGSPGLQQKQIWMIALACTYAARNQHLTHAIKADASQRLDAAEINAAKAAATIMAMNNIYYRFAHWMKDTDYVSMPANLRMSIIGNPGADKVSFELASMAVSAINGCDMCMNAHATHLEKAGVSKQGIQSAVRIGSVILATAVAQDILNTDE